MRQKIVGWHELNVRRLLITAALLGSLTISHAQAEVDNDPIEELVIQGLREQTTLRDSTHSVAVYRDETVRAYTELRLGELLRRIPNVTVDVDGEPTIRGMARFGIDAAGASATSLNYVDGAFSFLEPVLWDMRQIEVSRGAQNNATNGAYGGSIALSTNGPTSDPSGRVMARATDESKTREFGVAVGGPVTDTSGYRFAAYSRVSDGFITNTTRDDSAWNNEEVHLARIRYNKQLKRVNVGLKAEYLDRRRDGSNEIFLPLGGDPFEYESAFDAPQTRDRESLQFQVDLDFQAGERWEIDGVILGGTRNVHTLTDNNSSPEPGSVAVRRDDADLLGTEWYATYVADNSRIRLRHFWFKFDINVSGDFYFPIDLDGPGPLASAIGLVELRIPGDDISFFGTQATVTRYLGKWTLDAGILISGRRGSLPVSLINRRAAPTSDPIADAVYDQFFGVFADVRDDINQDSITPLPMLAASYEVSPNHTVGIKYERAHRFGNITVNSFRRTATEFDEEIADSLDWSWRGRFLDGRLSLQATLFYTKFKDLQVNANLSPIPLDSETVNAQRAHNAGLELEIDYRADHWSFFVAVAALEGEMDKIESGTLNYSGNDFPNAPDWSVSTGFEWRANSWFGSLDYTHRPDAEGSFDNRPGTKSEGRSLLNGRLGWMSTNGLSISLFGRNLLDDEYHLFAESGITPGSVPNFVPGDPREIGVQVNLEW